MNDQDQKNDNGSDFSLKNQWFRSADLPLQMRHWQICRDAQRRPERTHRTENQHRNSLQASIQQKGDRRTSSKQDKDVHF